MSKSLESFTAMTEVAPGASLMDLKRTTQQSKQAAQLEVFQKDKMEGSQ